MPDRVLSVSDLLADVGKCTVIVDGITCKNQVESIGDNILCNSTFLFLTC